MGSWALHLVGTIAMQADCLAVSMSFGGREEFGDGFGITILLRYILEYASNVREACELIMQAQGTWQTQLGQYLS